MDGVATLVDDPGDSSGTKRRRRRRARREAAATLEPAPSPHGDGTGNGAEMAPPDSVAEAQVVAVSVVPELESPVNQAILAATTRCT